MPTARKWLLVACAVMALTSFGASTALAMAYTPSGVTCRMYTVTRTAKSILFHSTVVTIELDTSVCFNGTEFVMAGENCKVAYQDSVTITVDPCITANYYYGWAPSGPQDPKGGYHSQATFMVRNCLFHWGCWSSATVTLELYISADGHYVKLDGR